jgi:hypothetical protein
MGHRSWKRIFFVVYPSARCHPLSTVRVDHAPIPGAVAMLDSPINHKGHCLHASVWMTRKCSTGHPVFGHHYEGIGKGWIAIY